MQALVTEVWHAVGEATALPADGKLAATLGGWRVLVVKTDDGLFALNDRCTHAASALHDGRLRRGAIMCPLHGARFEVKTGKCLGAEYRSLRMYPVRITDGMIEVAVPDSVPGMDDLPTFS